MGSYTKTGFPPSWTINQGGWDFVQSSPLTKMMGLLSGVIILDRLVTEEPIVIRSFKNELTRLRSNYPAVNFYAPDWINSSKTD